ncbi:MAG: hypothetical protein QM784_19350 [Polyangiaceae bacterium]
MKLGGYCRALQVALAVAVGLLVAACGHDDSVHDECVECIGSGETNSTILGGYWTTFVDRSGESQVVPYTGIVDMGSGEPESIQLARQIENGNGIEDGMYHVSGVVGVAPAPGDTSEVDTYWDGFYGVEGRFGPGVCVAAGCGVPLTREAGIGVDFRYAVHPLEEQATGKVGISFKLKLGPNHPRKNPISVSLAMDRTDVPNPLFGEKFGTLYAGLPPTGKAASSVNTPICLFPGTSDADGAPVGAEKSTCFAHMTTDGHCKLDVTTEMKTFCLRWDHFGPPAGHEAVWPSILGPYPLNESEPMWHSIGMRFEAYRPPHDAAAPAPFDFYVDDVILLDDARWAVVCTEADAVVPEMP